MTDLTEPLDPAAIAEELRGFAEGSTSARASLMRDAANVIDSLRIELLGWELGHGEALNRTKSAIDVEAILRTIPDVTPQDDFGGVGAEPMLNTARWLASAPPVTERHDLDMGGER